MAKQQNVLREKSSAGRNTSELEELVGYNLKRAEVIMQAGFKASQGKDGLAPRVFSALSLVVQNPDVTQSELARMLSIERSGLVAIIDELEGRNFLQRTTVPGDRRVQALVATPEGKAAYAKARAAVKANEVKLLSTLTAQEQSTLIALLRKIRAKEPK